MKKFLIILTIVAIMIMAIIPAAAIHSPQSISYYSIQTQVSGTGEAVSDVNKVEIGTDGTVTFTATETTEKFVFWNIKADDYDIVSGDYDDLVFTIRPKSDIIAIATFDDAILERAIPDEANTSTTSPKTGDSSAALWLLLGIMVISFAIIVCLKPWSKR